MAQNNKVYLLRFTMPNAFKGFALSMPLKDGQAKAEASGIYKDKLGKLHAIKASLGIEGDDLSEVFASSLLRKAFPNQFAECDFLASSSQTIYVRSAFLPHFQPLYIHKGTKNFIFSRGKKSKIFAEIKALGLTQDLANVLCGHLWIRNLDCHTENIGIIKIGTKKSVGTFDFGWGFTNICKYTHYRIDPFKKEMMVGKRADHTKIGGLPTNHFNDFPQIVNSQEMVRAMEKLIKIYENSIDKEVEKFVLRAIQNYTKAGKSERWVLSKLAKHVGLYHDHYMLQLLASNKKDDALIYLKEKLTYALQHRLLSLQLNKCLIDAKVQIETKQFNTPPEMLLENIYQSIIKIKNGPDKEYIRIHSNLETLLPSYSKSIITALLDTMLSKTQHSHNNSINTEVLNAFKGLDSMIDKRIDKIHELNSSKLATTSVELSTRYKT